MSRVHDMGGQTGFGAIPAGDDGPPFRADWEARVAALSTALMRRGIFTGDEFRDAIERIPPADYLGMAYYERWLAALELLLAEKKLLAPDGPAAVSGQVAGG
jgi:nitrile hydratase subunit beta